MNLFKAILLKVTSALVFELMSAMVRSLSESVPLGQQVFFRSAFAVLPVAVIYAWRQELHYALHTRRPLGHLGRGMIAMCSMFLNFAALAYLPLSDATAISFAAPLITVVFAALFLGERAQLFRWAAVGVGFFGVMVTLWPYLNLAQFGHGGSASAVATIGDRKSTRLNSSHVALSRMPSSA